MVLYKEGGKKNKKIHCLVLTAFDRPPKEGEECNHMDGITSNNYIKNLGWCTKQENCDHKINVLGKHNRGERNGKSKLTDQGIGEIRVYLKEGKFTHTQIAKIFNISVGYISLIKQGKVWKHIK